MDAKGRKGSLFIDALARGFSFSTSPRASMVKAHSVDTKTFHMEPTNRCGVSGGVNEELQLSIIVSI